MALGDWTVGGVSLTVPSDTPATYEIADIGVTIPVISGFTPSVVGRSAGDTGVRGSVRHIEFDRTGNYAAVITAINAILTALRPTPPMPYVEIVSPYFSGRFRLTRLRPTYPQPPFAAIAYLDISFEQVS